MKILALNQYYTPDLAASGALLCSLCEGLAEKGNKVDVICGMPSYTEDAPEVSAFEEKHNLTVKRISTGHVKGRSSMRKRVQGYVGFLLAGVVVAWWQAGRQKYDLVFTFSNPPFVGLLGVLLKHFKKVKFVYVLHDIHPDILIRTGRFKKGLFTSVWNIINKIILSNADNIVVLGPRMAGYLEQNKKVPKSKITVIHNWPIIDIEPLPKDNKSRQIYDLNDAFVLLYAGNLGILHNLDWVLDAAAKMNNTNLKFIFVGEGEKKASLLKRVEQQKLDNVLFIPYQKENILNSILCAADVCIVALEPELVGLAVPSKSYTIMAAGRPIIAITSKQDDVAMMVEQWKCGWIAESSTELTEIIYDILQQPEKVDLYGQQARIAYENAYSREKALEHYEALFQRMLNVN